MATGESSKKSGPWKSMEIRILGFVNSPPDEPYLPMRYCRVCDFEITVTPETTIRDIKDFTMARLTTLNYYQMKFEFLNKVPKDACTMKSLVARQPFFMTVKCLHLHIIVPDEMFKAMYKSFRDMGMNEEKALKATNDFMDTVHNKETDHEYDIAERLEKCRVRLEKHGIKITNPEKPVPCE